MITIKRILNSVSVGSSGFWFWMGSLAVVLIATFGVGMMALLFHTSMVGGLGIGLMVVVVGVLLGVSLGYEMRLRKRGEDIPSPLHKFNRIGFGITIAWAVTQLLFVAGMNFGAFIHFPSVLGWVLGLDVLIALVVLGSAYAAVGFGAKVGREFGMALAFFLVAANLLMGMVNLGESLVSPAIDGQLYYYYNTPSGKADEAHPSPEFTTGWFLTVRNRHLVSPNEMVTSRGKLATVVNFNDPIQAGWVDVWETEREAKRVSTVLSAVGWVGGALCSVLALAFVLGIAWRVIRSAWSSEGNRGGFLLPLFLFLGCGFIGLCMLGAGARILGLTPEVEGRNLWHWAAGGPNPFYRTLTVEPHRSQELGLPDQTEVGYLCQCGESNQYLAVSAQWHAQTKYWAENYGMRPHGCGRQVTFPGDQVFFVWNRMDFVSAPTKFLQAGESFTCPDGSAVSAPPLPRVASQP